MMKHFIALCLLASFLMTACNSLKKAENLYLKGQYQLAIEQLQKTKAAAGKKAVLRNFYMAQSYRKSNRLHEALPYYEKIYNKPIPKLIDPDDHPDDAIFYYALALKNAGKYDQAKRQFESYVRQGKKVEYVKRAQTEIENIERLQRLIKEKSYYEVENCSGLNSPAAEFSVLPLSARELLVSAARKENIYAANGQPFTGLYKVVLTDTCEGTYQVFSPNLFTDGINEATATLSPDGKTLIFARGNPQQKKNAKGQKNVKLFISEKVNGEWTPPRLLEGVSSNDEERYYGKQLPGSKPKAYAWDSSPAFSPDGERLYFASTREYDDFGNRNLGGSDLFYAIRLPDGSWGKVRHLGDEINTPGNEMFPVVSSDGKLYFASDGQPGFGQLDIFVATRSKGKITIRNLGAPVNSPYDDFAMTFDSDTTGYFSSNRPQGKGSDDIYRFIDRTPKTKIVRYYLAIRTLGIELNGTEQPLPNTRVRLLDKNEQLIQELYSNNRGWTDTLPVPENAEFIVLADLPEGKKQYLAAREFFTMAGRKIPQELLEKPETDTVLVFEVKLKAFEVNKTRFVYNILYDYNKWNIRPDAAAVLDRIVTFLRDNPNVTVELRSHTDSRGTYADNEILAQNRAQAAVDYIVSKGIDRERLKPSGYGEREPRVVDADLAARYPFLKEGDVLNDEFIYSFPDEATRELLHQLNRRTEIIITGVINTGR
ncbi:OmpA family protein [Thermonema rossianum]|uniref:OmpA family protein n=1 Tax=Thermonema rossianum TaxID=55505 RepID=UPI00068AA10D|nr:OmpA family protein [Thermonema rossianum]